MYQGRGLKIADRIILKYANKKKKIKKNACHFFQNVFAYFIFFFLNWQKIGKIQIARKVNCMLIESSKIIFFFFFIQKFDALYAYLLLFPIRYTTRSTFCRNSLKLLNDFIMLRRVFTTEVYIHIQGDVFK